jgi:hypothetical protein
MLRPHAVARSGRTEFLAPHLRTFLALAVTVVLALPGVAVAQLATTNTVQFNALDQNMWGPGNASQVSWSRNYSTSWNRTASIGGIVGSVGEVCFPNPFGEDPCVGTDTRTGAQLGAETNGTIGLKLNASATAGSVDVKYGGQASVTASAAALNPGGVLTLSSAFDIDPLSTSLASQFATFQASADFQFDVFARATARACAIGFGCTTAGGTIIDVNKTIELAAINRDNDGALRVLGVDVPLETSVGPVDVEAHVPNLQTTGTIVGNDLQSTGAQDLLELGVDVPQLVANAIIPGSGYALSGDFGFLDYSVFSSSIGPTLGMAQNFLFDATPMVQLAFSSPVQQIIGGVAQAATTSISFKLGQSIDVTSDFDNLEIVPFYFLQNTLRVITSATARLDASVDFLSLSADMPFGLSDLSLGPVFAANWSSPSATFTVDDRQFAMNFAQVQGGSMNVTATPEPGTMLLVGTGLLAIALVTYRRRRLAA